MGKYQEKSNGQISSHKVFGRERLRFKCCHILEAAADTPHPDSEKHINLLCHPNASSLMS